MKLGLIGYPLEHSWSPEIHAYLIHEPYECYPLKEEEVIPFLQQRSFDGINVTIPYKQMVIPYLDYLDPAVEKIGAVNCIINRCGKLYGYNTDYEGFKDMLLANHVPVKGKKVAILGTGGASAAIKEAIRSLEGLPTLVSRHPSSGSISYEELYRDSSYTILVNATPIGMFPNCDACPVDLERLVKLEYVIDIVANPLCTRLQFEARALGIPTLGGFEMLVRQALAADRLFLHCDISSAKISGCMHSLLLERRNIILIGMPSCGKSLLAKKLGKRTGRKVVEMDKEIEEKMGMSIGECFASKGEAYFRKQEEEAAKRHRLGDGSIISCGGGVVTQQETMRYLCENGIVIWINRDLSHLIATKDRPLSKDRHALENLWYKRASYYKKYSQIIVDNNGTLEESLQQLEAVIGG